MNIYLFVYHAIPTKGSLEFGKVGGAHIEIWVNEPTAEQAKTKALAYLLIIHGMLLS